MMKQVAGIIRSYVEAVRHRWNAARTGKLYPECLYVVTVTDDEIACVDPHGGSARVKVHALKRVLVETNDSGPVGIDVWWILEGESANDYCVFPQGAAGEDAALDRLSKLDGFRIDGMNCTQNRQFLCWEKKTY